MRTVTLLSLCIIFLFTACETREIPQQKQDVAKTPKESLVLPTATGSSQTVIRWLRYPDISPDGQFVAFTYKGDIYIGSTKGGAVRRLTTSSAHDTMPVWSPDGTQIAFVSNRYGNFDIYTIPSAGGIPKRITVHSSPDIWPVWTPNGDGIYFTSSRLDSQKSSLFPARSLPELYRITLADKRVTMVLTTPAEMLSVSSDGTRFLYTDKKGYENRFRKHHTSSVARDIWLYDSTTKKFKKLTTFKGEDRNAVWAENDKKIYYLSEKEGTFNVREMSADGSEDKAVTHLKTHPIRSLSISTNGLLTFSYNGDIYTLKAGQKPQKVLFRLPEENNTTDQLNKIYRNNVNDIALSADGKEALFTVHGDIYAVSLTSGLTNRLTATPEEERWVSLSPDGKEIVYASERNGSWNIYTMTRKNADERYFFVATEYEEKPLIVDSDDTFQPVYAPDGKTILYLRNRTTLMAFNRTTKQSTTLVPDNHIVSYIDGDQYYAVSPDGIRVATQGVDHNQWSGEIFLTALSDKRALTNLTNSGYDQEHPVWRGDGGMVAWISHTETTDIKAFLLNGTVWEQYRLTKEEKELRQPKKPAGTAPSQAKKQSATPKKPKKQPFDDTRIEDRTTTLSLVSRDYYMMLFSPDGETLYTFANTQDSYQIHAVNLREHKEKRLALIPHPINLQWWNKPPFDMKLSADGKKLLLNVAGQMMTLDTATKKLKPVTFSADFSVDRYKERAYLFDHVTRTVQEKLYDPNMHGVPWKMMVENYRRFLPHISNNFDFTEMLSELLGELNVSHTGSGYIYRPQGRDLTGQLGIFTDSTYQGKGLKIAEIIHGGPLDIADKPIEVGSIISHINGVALGTNPREALRLLNKKPGKYVRLTLTRLGQTRNVTVKPITPRQQSALLYKRWVERNRKTVDRLSNGRLGYVHIHGMDNESFQKVFSEVMGKYHEKEGIVIDTRFNGGGWLHNQLSIFFTGTPYSTYAYRGKSYFGGDPENRWTKKSILLVSEGNYSDAHFFAYAYRALHIGKIIGMPVAGTSTAVWWPDMLDNSMYFGIPEIGIRDTKGTFLENQELVPDIVVENTPDIVARGEDAQLERAVSELLKEK